MKKIILAAAFMLLTGGAALRAEGNTDAEAKAGIGKTLDQYFAALNASNVNEVMPLYTSDGVFMPANLPTATGTTALKASYTGVFKAIQLKVKYTLDEVRVSGNEAFVQTHSTGTTLIHASGKTVQEGNREFYIFRKEGDTWKIARYMFNSPQ